MKNVLPFKVLNFKTTLPNAFPAMYLGLAVANEKQEQGSFLKDGVVSIRLVMKNNY